jgi:hypothetical protein
MANVNILNFFSFAEGEDLRVEPDRVAGDGLRSVDDDGPAGQVRAATSGLHRQPLDEPAGPPQSGRLDPGQEGPGFESRGRQRGPVVVAGRDRNPHRASSKALDGTPVLLQDLQEGRWRKVKTAFNIVIKDNPK